MLTNNEGFDIIRKPERNRITGNTIIPSYGKFEVHNEKFNKILKYITDTNKQYNDKITNPNIQQKALNDALKQQLDLYRLKILYQNYQRITNENDKKSAITELLLYLGSFRDFCGPGTEIYKQIREDNDNPSNMFKIDRICRDHDISFTHAKTLEDQQRADEIFMKEILEKYIINADKSILGTNPKSFDTWSNGFKTIMSYAMSGIEGIVSASVIKSGFDTIYKAGRATKNIVINPLQTFENIKDIGYTLSQTSKEMLRTVNQATRFAMRQSNVYVPPSFRTPIQYASFLTKRTGLQLLYTLRELSNSINPDIQKFLITAGFTTLIKDKILAVISLGAIAGKYILENIVSGLSSPELKEYFEKSGILIGIVKDEVSDEDMTNLIKMYSIIQNEILKESNMPEIEPITEKDYENIELIKNPEILINDFKNIYIMQNENITTKFDRYLHEEPPQYTEEELMEASKVYNETLENPIEVIDKITNYLNEKSNENINLEKNLEENEINDFVNAYFENEKSDNEDTDINDFVNAYFENG